MSQETSTQCPIKTYIDSPLPHEHVSDVLKSEDISVEDGEQSLNYEREDDEVNKQRVPKDPFDKEDFDSPDHVKPDHRFKLISLDNIVHLNPALQVSLWLMVGLLVKIG